MINKTTTLWNLLNNQKIQIPIIQRDYAQGRIGKEYIRKSFLLNLKEALDGKLPNGEIKLKLDFVYGAKDDQRINPLDGQQRLTTLWLLYWYISLKAGLLESSVERLMNFTYETRISSREFCQQLCTPLNFTNYQQGSVVDYIINQVWFYNDWQQDPTIDSMLRMLKGTTVCDSKNNDIIDGIEELFINTSQKQFVSYFEILTHNEPIVFYYLSLDNFGLSDDLYVKMNARGKQLTSFENFKADLIGFLERKAKEEPDGKWGELLEAPNGIPTKMDGTWTDIFWNNKSEGLEIQQEDGTSIKIMDHQIDEIYFEFINRFFWNELFVAKDENDEYVLSVGRDEDSNTIENNNISYAFLNDSKNKNTRYSKISYEGFEPYRYCQNTIPYEFFEKIEYILDNYNTGFNDILNCPWDDSFSFIPIYDKSKDGFNVIVKDNHEEPILLVKSLTQSERIVFYAICQYFSDKRDVNSKTLRSWMRVVWNLVSAEDEAGNSVIRSTRAVRNAIEYISGLDSRDVYNSLINKQNNREGAFGQRCFEECLKAKKIVNEPHMNWEQKLADAEKYSFFRGAIKFLYKDENGEENWSNFDIKWECAKNIFKEKSVKDEASTLNEKYNNSELLKKLFSFFDTHNFKQIYWNYHVFNNKAQTWRYYLLNEHLSSPIHKLLMGYDKISLEKWKECDIKGTNSNEKVLYILAETNLLDFVMTNIPTSWIRNDYHGHYAIYPSAKGIFLDAEIRDDFLINTKAIHIDEKIIIDGAFLYANEVYFNYNNYNFMWNDYYDRNDEIYLLDSNCTLVKEVNHVTALPTNELLNRLDSVIAEYEKIKKEVE